MRRLTFLIAVFVGVFVLTACVPPGRPVMGASRLNGDQIANWYEHKQAKLGLESCLTHDKSVRDLAHIFVQEGAIEGVRGDIAFAQSMLETGYLQYGGRVPCSANNYSGLGATDSTSDYEVFARPRRGVRAQIQHLRRYADPTAKKKNLHRPLVDPRFRLVKPPGKAPSWDDMGNGNWATSPTYAGCVMKIYNNMLKFNGQEKEGRRPC